MYTYKNIDMYLIYSNLIYLGLLLHCVPVLKKLTGLLFIVGASNNAYPQTWKSYVGIEKMEDEYVLTSAEYLLSLAHLKPTSSGKVLF